MITNQSRVLRLSCCVDGRRSSTFLRQFHQFEPNLAHARMDKADFPGDAIGYINFAPFLIRTPVIYSYQLKFPVACIDHSHERPERQMRMRGRQSLAVENLPIGRLAAVESGSIPAGIAYPRLDRLRRLAEM